MKMRLLLAALIALPFLGCGSSEIEVTDARASRSEQGLSVTVDVVAHGDLTSYCVRTSFWTAEADLIETVAQCFGELESQQGRTHTLETSRGGERCATLSVEATSSFDDDEPATFRDGPQSGSETTGTNDPPVAKTLSCPPP